MKLSVFCGESVDGFLARPNHALDFLDAGGQEPHGFDILRITSTITGGRIRIGCCRDPAHHIGNRGAHHTERTSYVIPRHTTTGVVVHDNNVPTH